MGNLLKVKLIKKYKNRIEYDYEYSGKWNLFLNAKESFFVEYNESLGDVPDSLAVIPFLSNILPLSWVFDLNIEVNCLDKKFYDNLKDVKEGYKNMYPEIRLGGDLFVKNIEKNIHETDYTGVMFSGGVDAYNTLINHIEEKPILFTVWGADLRLNDLDGWSKVNADSLFAAKKYDLKYIWIKSNIKDSIDYNNIMLELNKLCDKEWYHDFQHGLALLGLVAPLAINNSLKKLYIASSFTKEQIGSYTCASDPTIDNHVRFGMTKVIHDGYEFNRQQKIQNICNYVEKNKTTIKLRVCWESSGGDNCCECEKCYRTIMGIIAERQEPKKFGLNISERTYKKMIKDLPSIAKYSYNRYINIQKRFNENYSLEETPKELLWFRTLKIKKEMPKIVKLYRKVKNKFRKLLSKIFKLLGIK